MELSKNTYNGFTNYETWKIQLEVFHELELDHKAHWTELSSIAEEVCLEGIRAGSPAQGIVISFLAEVNWRELETIQNIEFETRN